MNIPCKLPATLLFILAVAACGQSGPLYLPGDPSEVHNLSTELPETEAQSENENENENDPGTSDEDASSDDDT
jgi:predicted small lipoprotein YifL